MCIYIIAPPIERKIPSFPLILCHSVVSTPPFSLISLSCFLSFLIHLLVSTTATFTYASSTLGVLFPLLFWNNFCRYHLSHLPNSVYTFFSSFDFYLSFLKQFLNLSRVVVCFSHSKTKLCFFHLCKTWWEYYIVYKCKCVLHCFIAIVYSFFFVFNLQNAVKMFFNLTYIRFFFLSCHHQFALVY